MLKINKTFALHHKSVYPFNELQTSITKFFIISFSKQISYALLYNEMCGKNNVNNSRAKSCTVREISAFHKYCCVSTSKQNSKCAILSARKIKDL